MQDSLQWVNGLGQCNVVLDLVEEFRLLCANLFEFVTKYIEGLIFISEDFHLHLQHC